MIESGNIKSLRLVIVGNIPDQKRHSTMNWEHRNIVKDPSHFHDHHYCIFETHHGKFFEIKSDSVFHFYFRFWCWFLLVFMQENSSHHEDYSPFLVEYIILKRNNMGIKWLIRVEGCVGLFLTWTRTRGFIFVLQMIFDITSSKYYSIFIMDITYLYIHSVLMILQRLHF